MLFAIEYDVDDGLLYVNAFLKGHVAVSIFSSFVDIVCSTKTCYGLYKYLRKDLVVRN